MYYPTPSELDAAALIAHPGFAGYTDEQKDEAIADGLMWLTIWRSVYPAVGSAPHGLGPCDGEVPPVALLRASKMSCEAFDTTPFAEKRVIREKAVLWLGAWRFVLAMGQPPADYVRADPRFVSKLRQSASSIVDWPLVDRLGARIDPIREAERHATAKWAPDLGFLDRCAIWIVHRVLRLADRMWGGRGK